MMLTSPRLSALSGIVHGFFTREGGVSGGVYASLNGGLGSNDDPVRVTENRRRMAETLKVAPAHWTPFGNPARSAQHAAGQAQRVADHRAGGD